MPESDRSPHTHRGNPHLLSTRSNRLRPSRVQIGHPSPLPPCQVSPPPFLLDLLASIRVGPEKAVDAAYSNTGSSARGLPLCSTAACARRTAQSFPLSLDHDRTLSQACHVRVGLGVPYPNLGGRRTLSPASRRILIGVVGMNHDRRTRSHEPSPGRSSQSSETSRRVGRHSCCFDETSTVSASLPLVLMECCTFLMEWAKSKVLQHRLLLMNFPKHP